MKMVPVTDQIWARWQGHFSWRHNLYFGNNSFHNLLGALGLREDRDIRIDDMPNELFVLIWSQGGEYIFRAIFLPGYTGRL